MRRIIDDKSKETKGSTKHTSSRTSSNSSIRHDGRYVGMASGSRDVHNTNMSMGSVTVETSSRGRLELGKTKPKPPPIKPSNFDNQRRSGEMALEDTFASEQTDF
jgi:hypothetical protein